MSEARPMRGHPALPHWCGKDECGLNVSARVNPYCGHRGPHVPVGGGPAMPCMRIRGHGGNHSAYVASVATPTEWAS